MTLDKTVIELTPDESGTAKPLTPEEVMRYSRQLLLPDVGSSGQRKLKEAKVLTVGAGGLGSPCSFYLAAAGIGTLGIIDDDLVDLSNLQRQILHGEADVGKAKADSASKTLKALNSDIEVIPLKYRLTTDNVMEAIGNYDLVIDGSDNFPTKYLLNDACYFAEKPLVSGSVLMSSGQLTFIDSKEGPCYRCLYSEPPPADQALSCADVGVLGVVPGLIGVLQATEAIKHFVGSIGDPLIGKLLVYHADNYSLDILNVRKRPDCDLCGEKPLIKGLLENYEWSCTL